MPATKQSHHSGPASDAHAARRTRLVLTTVGVGILAYLLAHASTTFFRLDEGPSALWWPVTGVAAAVIVRLPRRWWFASFITFAIGLACANQLFFNPVGTAVSVSFNVIELVTVCLALTGRSNPPIRHLRNLREALRFATVVAVVMLATGPIFALPLWNPFTDVAWWDVALSYGIGHLLSLASLAPLLLPPMQNTGQVAFHSVEGVAIVSAIIGINLWAYLAPAAEGRGFLILLPLLWAASRLTAVQATAAAMVSVVVIAHGTRISKGAFAFTGDVLDKQVSAQLLIAAVSISTFALVMTTRRRQHLTDVAADRRSELQSTLATAPMPAVTIHLQPPSIGKIETANNAIAALLHYPVAELTGKQFETLLSPPRGPAHTRIDRELITLATGEISTATWDAELTTGTGGNKHTRILASRITPAHDAAFLVVYVTDVTSIEREKEALRDAAEHDPLTGIVNRAFLETRLAAALEDITAYPDRHAGVLYIDLDEFKAVNDTHGHPIGDAVLVEVAGRLRAAVRPADTVARVGGDEFVVLCHNLDSIASLSEIMRRVETTLLVPIPVGRGMAVSIGASIGSAILKPGGSPEHVIAHADTAMYMVKRQHHRTTDTDPDRSRGGHNPDT